MKQKCRSIVAFPVNMCNLLRKCECNSSFFERIKLMLVEVYKMIHSIEPCLLGTKVPQEKNGGTWPQVLLPTQGTWAQSPCGVLMPG